MHPCSPTRARTARGDLLARPWIDQGKVAAGDVVAVVARCPTGALQAIFENGRAAEAVSTNNELRIVADGPHQLRGDIEIRDGSAETLARKSRLALCRCGASGKKPCCDGSHLAIEFKS